MHSENAKEIADRPPHSKVEGGVRPGEMVVMRLRKGREEGRAELVVRDRIREIMEHRKLKDHQKEARMSRVTTGTTRTNSVAHSSPFLTRYSSIYSSPENPVLFKKSS